jgi:hypothetical protein
MIISIIIVSILRSIRDHNQAIKRERKWRYLSSASVNGLPSGPLGNAAVIIGITDAFIELLLEFDDDDEEEAVAGGDVDGGDDDTC